MARKIELTEKELNTLLTSNELSINLASRTIHIFSNKEGKELLMNYEGEGYRPIKVTIEFEYDENLKFTEED